MALSMLNMRILLPQLNHCTRFVQQKDLRSRMRISSLFVAQACLVVADQVPMPTTSGRAGLTRKSRSPWPSTFKGSVARAKIKETDLLNLPGTFGQHHLAITNLIVHAAHDSCELLPTYNVLLQKQLALLLTYRVN